MRGAGFGVLGFSVAEEPGQEGFVPRVTLGKFLKVSFARWGRLEHVVVMVMSR